MRTDRDLDKSEEDEKTVKMFSDRAIQNRI
jgi:hypothetical protein